MDKISTKEKVIKTVNDQKINESKCRYRSVSHPIFCGEVFPPDLQMIKSAYFSPSFRIRRKRRGEERRGEKSEKTVIYKEGSISEKKTDEK